MIPIDLGVDLNAEPVIQYGCDGIFPFSTVTVQMADNSVLDAVLFALDPVDPTDAITADADIIRTWGDLPAGDHTVYIYHENGCTNFVEFTMEAYEPLTLDATKSGPNEITATATGGFGGYEFFFQGDSYGSQNVFNINFDANVTIRVVDSNGCEASIAFPFDFDGMVEFPNFFTPDGDGMNDTWAPLNRDFFPNIEVIICDNASTDETETMQQRCPPTYSQRGFTLIEMTLVVLLLGLLANLTLPLLSSMEVDRLNATARRISGTVKYLYNEAIMTGLEQRLVFDLADNSFITAQLDPDGELRENSGPGRRYQLPESVRIESIFQPQRGERREGQITTAMLPGGWLEETIIHLRNDKDRQMTLRLVPLTGTTELYEGYWDLR